MKLCKDCKHWTPDTRSYGSKPKQEAHALCAAEHSPVDGWPEYPCHVQRRYGWLESRFNHSCGREGRWFEPKVAGEGKDG